MKQKLEEYLEENGFEAQHDDNDVMFSVNGLNYLCHFYPEDPYFIQLMLPQVDDKSAKDLRDVIADINRRFKVAKIIEVDDKPWIVAECFTYSSENGKILIGRMVKLLTDVIMYYRRQTSEPVNNEEG